MAAPASSITTRLAYGVTQLPRVAWYLGHGLALRRLAEAARGGDGAKARRRIQTNGSVPDRNRLYADMARLFSQDFANVESGIYPLPADHDGSLGTLINRSRWNSQCVRDRSRTSFVVGKAEAIPLANNSQDAATSIFLFHELPPKVRRSTLRECARVLKPGGRLILLDSLQLDDQSDYEGLLQLFPQNYHEPYYTSYTKEDFRAPASVSKVMVFDKALAGPAGT